MYDSYTQYWDRKTMETTYGPSSSFEKRDNKSPSVQHFDGEDLLFSSGLIFKCHPVVRYPFFDKPIKSYWWDIRGAFINLYQYVMWA